MLCETFNAMWCDWHVSIYQFDQFDHNASNVLHPLGYTITEYAVEAMHVSDYYTE